jgi:hypothetical protein
MVALALALAPAGALACSPVADPTIAALGPGQVVLLGVTGERVPSGRLFHVERAWNGDIPTSPIVIAFQEGEPVGDCSYPVPSLMRLVIAPDRAPDGSLTANLATLQADPRSPDGVRYLAEARRLFGDGTVPVDTTPAASPSSPWLPLAVVAVVVIAVALAAVVVRRRGRGSDPA